MGMEGELRLLRDACALPENGDVFSDLRTSNRCLSFIRSIKLFEVVKGRVVSSARMEIRLDVGAVEGLLSVAEGNDGGGVANFLLLSDIISEDVNRLLAFCKWSADLDLEG